MKLSVIVPVYNMAAEGRLQFCLDSLVNQTISDYEILAVDDASTDQSPEILREYAEKYPGKLRVLTHQVNRRQGGAKNTGLKAAAGEWGGFIDSDDWVTPDYYEKLLRRAEETGADMVGCDYSLVDSHSFEVGRVVRNNSAEQTGVLDREKHGRLIMRSGSMVIKIYKRQVITENHLDFPEGIFYEDNCAGPVWSLYFKRFERVEEPLYYYYQHQTSTVHHVSEEKCRDRMKAAALMLEQCRERGFLEQYYPEIQYRFTELYYGVTLFSYMLGCPRRKLSFVRELGRGMRETFPDFQENAYYRQYTDPEEQRMIALQMRSDARFFYYYGLKVWVRGVKKFVRARLRG